MFVGAYWSQREESREAAGERIVVFLKAIGGHSQEFASWFGKARSRSAAFRSPLMLDQETVASKLRVNRRDADRKPIPELGFEFSVWNGKDTSFSAAIGAFSRHVDNSAVLDIGGDNELDRETYRALLEEAVRAFEPEHAVVTSHDHLAQTGAQHPWEAGWFTYGQAEGLREHSYP